MTKSTRLRELIQGRETLVMPDAYDALSARIIERMGFQAVQCSGFSIALTACCCQEKDLGLEENLRATRHIVEAVSVPVMADGEDGFGDASIVRQTVSRYIEVGAAGVNIEDQVLGAPGAGKQVIARQLMMDKIAAARRAAIEEGKADFVINGRTDALVAARDRAAGLEEAIERANLYLRAGADLAFVVGVAELDEARRLVQHIAGPVSIAAGLPYNMKLSVAELKACGVARVSLPMTAMLAGARAIAQTLSRIAAGESFAAMTEQGLLPAAKEISDLLSQAEPKR